MIASRRRRGAVVVRTDRRRHSGILARPVWGIHPSLQALNCPWQYHHHIHGRLVPVQRLDDVVADSEARGHVRTGAPDARYGRRPSACTAMLGAAVRRRSMGPGGAVIDERRRPGVRTRAAHEDRAKSLDIKIPQLVIDVAITEIAQRSKRDLRRIAGGAK